MEKKGKLIKDVVHGYINVKPEYVKIIDTPLFQRLRRIEQTSIRSLYPCAHHDRFIHSLGTYHLGCIAINKMLNNSRDYGIVLNDDTVMVKTFEIACLLHDCGHSPFSHTFEKYFELSQDIDALLVHVASDEEFEADLSSCLPKPHEKVSAYLVLTRFAGIIHEIDPNIDLTLIARMILGCVYRQKKSETNSIKNCIIGLLNGKVIDVDKLDYTARDRLNSGYNATTVDIERLLSSLVLKKKDEVVFFCIKKNALSQVESILDSRYFQQTWVIPHHTVVYDQYLLQKSVKTVAKILGDGKEDEVLNKIFNVDIFSTPVEIKHEKIYQICDGDLIYLINKFADQNSYAQEWLERAYRLKPLWKTNVEFLSCIGKKSNAEILANEKVTGKSVDQVFKQLEQKYPDKNWEYYFSYIKPSSSCEKSNSLYVDLGNEIVSYTQLGIPERTEKNAPYFLLYVSDEVKPYYEEIIHMIVQFMNI